MLLEGGQKPPLRCCLDIARRIITWTYLHTKVSCSHHCDMSGLADSCAVDGLVDESLKTCGTSRRACHLCCKAQRNTSGTPLTHRSDSFKAAITLFKGRVPELVRTAASSSSEHDLKLTPASADPPTHTTDMAYGATRRSYHGPHMYLRVPSGIH